jgi:hypothetical protein
MMTASGIKRIENPFLVAGQRRERAGVDVRNNVTPSLGGAGPHHPLNG